ncbi:MAG: methylenetetrahydrofolate reductase [Candidatus Asgardarchaeum californiense]|nr:MAG: methylenetetrahydrofolate reductase [Candidatus Asgardarchaeum californiense]
MEYKNKSNLEKVLSEGKFAVTAEIGPPKGSDPDQIKQKAEILKGYAHAYNITDNQAAVVRMSSLAGCCILLGMEMEPVMQMACRDRNRIALQSDVLGASALGIRNILFITGDHQSLGNHPSSRGVYDIDSIQLIQIVKNMRDNGIFQNGEEILRGNPSIFIGSAANPYATPYEIRVDRLEKKIYAGVDFIQTQSVFNIERFNEWMDEVRSRGLDKKVHILAGVTPLKSIKMTERMKYYIPGVDVPDAIEKRMKNASDPKKEGYEIALEIIKEIKKIKGIHGVHITALFWESIIPSLISESGLVPR